MRGRPLSSSQPGLAKVHPRLEALFVALEDSRIEWSLLRGESELDGRPGDVDILVAPGELGRLGLVARAVGYARLPSAGYGSHEFRVAYDEATDQWLKLDLVTELAFGTAFAFRLPETVTAACLARRRPAGSAFVLDPADGFWTLLLHGLVDKAAIDGATRGRLEELAPAGRTGGPVAAALAPLLPAGWSLGLVVDAVTSGGWAELDRLGRGLTTSWRRRHPVDSLVRRATGPIRLRAGRLARLRRPRGLGLVLVGAPILTAGLATQVGQAVPLPVRMPSLPPAGRSPGRSLRDRLKLGQCLVIFRAGTLDELPIGWVRGEGVGRSRLADALSSPAPDLVIVLGTAALPAQSGAADAVHSSDRSDIRTVDASVSEERLGRIVAGLVWERLAERWNALEGQSTGSS